MRYYWYWKHVSTFRHVRFGWSSGHDCIYLHLALLAFSLLVSTGPYLEHLRCFKVKYLKSQACAIQGTGQAEGGVFAKKLIRSPDFRLNPSVRGLAVKSRSSFNDRVCRHRVKRRASCQCAEVSGFLWGNQRSRGKRRQQQRQHQEKEITSTICSEFIIRRICASTASSVEKKCKQNKETQRLNLYEYGHLWSVSKQTLKVSQKRS